MLADLFRGIILGIVMWLLLFAAGTVIMSTLGSGLIGVILIFIVPVISAPIAWFYLKNDDITEKLYEGLRLGAVWAITGLFLDAMIMAFILGRGFGYFLSWTLWLGYCEMVIFSTTVGYILTKMKKRWLRA